MKRVAVFGSIAQFEAFVNDAKVSVIDVKVSTCEQSYNFQECFIGVVFYEDAPLNTAESPATDSQQLKAEIAAMQKVLDSDEAKGEYKISIVVVNNWLRQLSAV